MVLWTMKNPWSHSIRIGYHHDYTYMWEGGFWMGVTSAWFPLGNFFKIAFCLSSNKVFLFFVTKFFVFAFRWFRVFHWGCYVYFRIIFSSNSLYILYIFIFIYFIYFVIVQWVLWSVLGDFSGMLPPDWSSSTHFVHIWNCLKYILMVSLWHPGDGRDFRKKPLPYNYFFTSLF